MIPEACFPGVTVEATNPAMIEGARSVVTDNQGRYRFEAMRPGTYKLTFSLTGFGTVLREGISLPSNFTATVNAEMNVGALEEPSTCRAPRHRSTPAGVAHHGNRTRRHRHAPDFPQRHGPRRSCGGRQARILPMSAVFRRPSRSALRARGLGGFDGEQQVEGMSIESYEGGSQSFFDDTLQSEMTVTTSSIPADTGGGCFRLNMILKDGGNQFSGSAFMGGTKGTWLANNIDDNLRIAQLRRWPTVSTTSKRSPPPSAVPSFRDGLWRILSARHQSTETTIANVPKYVTTALGRNLEGDQRPVRPQPGDAADVAGNAECRDRRILPALVAQAGPFDRLRHRRARRRATRPEKRASRHRQHQSPPLP